MQNRRKRLPLLHCSIRPNFFYTRRDVWQKQYVHMYKRVLYILQYKRLVMWWWWYDTIMFISLEHHLIGWTSSLLWAELWDWLIWLTCFPFLPIFLQDNRMLLQYSSKTRGNEEYCSILFLLGKERRLLEEKNKRRITYHIGLILCYAYV